MRLVLRILAVLILGPIALILVLAIAAAGIIGLPLLWERVIARFTAPPEQHSEPA